MRLSRTTRPIHWAVYKVDDERRRLIAKKAKVEVAISSDPPARRSRPAGRRHDGESAARRRRAARYAQPGRRDLVDAAIKTGELFVVDMLVKAGAIVTRGKHFSIDQREPLAAAEPSEKWRRAGKLLLRGNADVRPRPLDSDGEPDYFGASRAVSARSGLHRTAVRGTRRTPCARRELRSLRLRCEYSASGGVTPLMIAPDPDYNGRGETAARSLR